MYHSEPQGQHHIGVCINPGCAILGGDAVYAAVSERLGIDHDEVTADGKFSLERIECQAACTHAPAMTVNWEFMDLVTPESAVNTIDKLANGESVESTRGPVVGTWRDTARVLAGFDDGKTDEGVAADELMLAGLKRAKELGMTAPSMTNGASHAEAGQ
jgi:NADH-quinone oxidoreductase subunit E